MSSYEFVRTSSIRVGIVDDHPLFRLGLRHALAADPVIDVVWDVGSGEEALVLYEHTKPDVLMVDLQLAFGMDGLDLCARLLSRDRSARVITISAFTDPSVAVDAAAAGARMHLGKDMPIKEVAAALKEVMSQPRPRRAPRPNTGRLSRRESEVLREIRAGLTNREIASSLGLSTTTVNKHVHSILQKLGVRNRAQAASLPSFRVTEGTAEPRKNQA